MYSTDIAATSASAVAMKAYRVTPGQVYSAIAGNNTNIGAKVVEQNGQEYVIHGLGLVEYVEDINNIVITQNNNVPVYVKNVARVNLVRTSVAV